MDLSQIIENQFRDYYERLQDTFGNEFREFLETGVHGGDNTLNAMINNKIITVEGNYENENWIDDKLAGRYTQKRKQIKIY